MRNRKVLISLALVLAVFVLAVPSMTPRAYGAAAKCVPTCAIAILSPGSGAVLNKNNQTGPTFLVSFLVHNFSLVAPGTYADVNTTATGPNHNEGHIHVFVDNAYITIWTSVNGIPLTLSPGTHTIRLDLVNDFHQEFSPGVNATTTVSVVDPVQSSASSGQSNAGNAMYFSLGALIVSIISVILVAYVAFGRKPKMA